MLIDITRLADRFLQNRLPTGVDRVSLQYLLHFFYQARALVRFAGRWVELGETDSRRVFDILLKSDPAGRSALRLCVARAYAFAWRGQYRNLLLNTGHSGLDRPGYALRVGSCGLKPVFFLHDLIPISHPEYCRVGEALRHHQRLETMLSVAKMRAHPLGARAAVIGEVTEDPHHFVQMKTGFGGRRIVDWLSGEQLPRIC